MKLSDLSQEQQSMISQADRAALGLSVAPLPPRVNGAVAMPSGDAPNVEGPQGGNEGDLQEACESWLIRRGYLRLTASNAECGASPRGWFGHWPRCIGNPLMPDLLVLNPGMTSCLMVELKARNVWQPGQREMVASGEWRLACSVEEFTRQIEGWEAQS